MIFGLYTVGVGKDWYFYGWEGRLQRPVGMRHRHSSRVPLLGLFTCSRIESSESGQSQV